MEDTIFRAHSFGVKIFFLVGFLVVCTVFPAEQVYATTVAPVCPAGPIFSVGDFNAVADGKTDSTDAINRALACASNFATQQKKPATVQFGSGNYFLACAKASNTPCLKLLGVSPAATSGIHIFGASDSSTQLIIGNPDAGGLYVTNVANLTIKNLIIDYSVLPFTQGKVVAIGSNTFDFQTSPGMRDIPASLCAAYGTGKDAIDASPNGVGYYPSENFGIFMDSANGQLVKRNANMISLGSTPSSCSQVGTNTWRIGIDPSEINNLKVGDHYVQLIGRHWTKNTIYINNSENIVVSNSQVRAGGAIALLFTNDTGSILVDRFQVRFAPGSNRFLTTNADGIHMANNHAIPTISHCFFQGMADDGINLHANANYAAAIDSNGVTLEVTSSPPVLAGDSIEVISRATGKVLGSATVSAVAADPNKRGYSVLTLNSGITGIQVDPIGRNGDQVFNLSAAEPKALIMENTFMRHRGRDILEHSPNSKIYNNLFSDINWMAIQLDVDLNWGEGPTAHNVRIQDNQFYGGSDILGSTQVSVAGANGPSGLPPNGPSGIVLVNNRFANVAHSDWNIILSSTDSAVFNQNQISSSNCASPSNVGILVQASTNPLVINTIQSCSIANPSLPSNFDPSMAISLGSDHYYGSMGSGGVEGFSSPGVISGWAVDNANMPASIMTNLYLDGPYPIGTSIGGILASDASPDLSWAPGNHRFHFPVPSTVHGWHTLYVYAVPLNPAISPFLITPSSLEIYIP